VNIAIIGAGNVGRTLAGDIRIASNAEAASSAEVVVLATPWSATQEAVASCGDLSGKIVIDCTNPLTPDFSGLALGFHTSGAERVASWAKGAQVFKTLNQIGFNLMDNPRFPGGTPVMFVCGDGTGKDEVLGLVKELGFDAVDAGGLVIARLLEPYAMRWIHLALVQGLGQAIGFALLRR
jgi:predicted dinucleotide-binding enzyme